MKNSPYTAKQTQYVSRELDADGLIAWSDAENSVWQDLMTRHDAHISNTACAEYIDGLRLLDLPRDRIPQLAEVDTKLMATTGWRCAPVPALIGFGEFFRLLSEKQFPVATFIRSREEFDYLQEPDIFHEIVGHCPLLTNQIFADFTEAYGKMGLNATKEQRVYLARLYWFTVEFGLLQTDAGLKVYGGGIISSLNETQYALNDDTPERKVFDIMEVLRTPYRIDIMQPIYYTLNNVQELADLRQYSVDDIMGLIEQAKALGEFPAKFPIKR